MTDIVRPSRETMTGPARVRGERRAVARVMPSQPHAVSFSHAGRICTGTLHDTSARGIGIRLDPLDELGVREGDEIEVSVCVPGETVTRRLKVAWVRLLDGGYRLGGAWLALGPDAECVGLLNLDQVKIDPALALRVSPIIALRRQVLPFAAFDGHVYVACLNAHDTQGLQALERVFNQPLRCEAAEPESLRRALERVYGDANAAQAAQARGRSIDVRSVDLKSPTDLAPDDTVALCDELMHAAILRQASDIHVDPEPEAVSIRFRIDGVLDLYRRLPLAAHSGLTSRFKVLAGLDIAEKRAPQDGGFKHRYGRANQAVDVRVATLPTRYGERMTLRLLALQTEGLTLERLGMCPRDLQTFREAIDKPHGMVLLTGPTGSGKTTTLYAAIRKLIGRENLNVITIEDPIEYEIPGVGQVEVDAADKVSFGKALRSVLRHDPDVVMIGEVRDLETADVAIKASLTGHLVFSTLHTNSAASVITRLAHMGVERYLIAATLRLAVAQRLVRRLCPRCRKPRPATAAEASALGRASAAGLMVHDPAGCIYCGNRGYVGRVALFEMLPLDEDWARRIVAGAEESELLERMRQQHLATLIDDGAEKALTGLTSVSEVLGAAAVW